MKNIIFVSLIFSAFSLFAQQAKKPTLMILPSDNRCTVRYFTKTYDNQEGKVVSADYRRAFLEDSKLSPVSVENILMLLYYTIKVESRI